MCSISPDRITLLWIWLIGTAAWHLPPQICLCELVSGQEMKPGDLMAPMTDARQYGKCSICPYFISNRHFYCSWPLFRPKNEEKSGKWQLTFPKLPFPIALRIWKWSKFTMRKQSKHKKLSLVIWNQTCTHKQLTLSGSQWWRPGTLD